MRPLAFAFVGAIVALAPAAIGYRIGTGHWPVSTSAIGDGAAVAPSEAMPAANLKALYWRDPDGKPTYAANPMKTSEGRDFVPVYENAEADFPVSKVDAAKAAVAAAPTGERKVKYYRNPMGLPDTSPVPKKDSMSMDYIPVYEDDADDGKSVKVSLDKVQRSGVKSEPAEMRKLARPVRAPGVAKIDERTIREITLRSDGYIDKLYVAEMGKHVAVGDPLFRVYSPDIVKAEVDYKIARDATVGQPRGDAQRDLQGAITRLENLDVPQAVIKAIETGRDATPMKIDWPSPVNGVVIEKKVVEGQKVEAGAMLFQIADLGKIWVIADVAEQDIGPVKVGAPATVAFRAFPGEVFEGKVTFILHELDMQTRTAKVRIEIANPEHRIRHDMYADVTIDTGDEDAPRLAVPTSAVLDTGTRQAVLVDKGDGRFEPRPVKLGVRGDGYVEVKDGIAQGDKVVTSANFLIDAESNLKAALEGFSADTPTPAASKAMPDAVPQTSAPTKPMQGPSTAEPMTKPVPEKMSGPMKPSGSSAEARP